MKRLTELLKNEPRADGYRINEQTTSSYELFFVHEKLETVRSTDTVDTTVTVYSDHDGCRGDSSFAVYRSMSEDEIKERISSAVDRANLVFNEMYELPEAGEMNEKLETNIDEYDPKELGRKIADAVFSADADEGCTVNALEVFIYRDVKRVVNSRGVDKTETVWRAMVEAIPTFTDGSGSVELYENIRFTVFDEEKIKSEISEKMREVRDRARAERPDVPMEIDLVLRPFEIGNLMFEISDSLDYASVYAKANLWSEGERVQPEGDGDRISVTVKPAVRGSDRSSFFDEAGTTLQSVRIIENGAVKSYHGSDRFGQYLGVTRPSGVMDCIEVAAGTMTKERLACERYIECASLSGLQVEIFSDYIGGEIRLAYLHENGVVRPVTGITFSARLSEVLKDARLSAEKVTERSYEGPSFMLLKNVSLL